MLLSTGLGAPGKVLVMSFMTKAYCAATGRSPSGIWLAGSLAGDVASAMPDGNAMATRVTAIRGKKGSEAMIRPRKYPPGHDCRLCLHRQTAVGRSLGLLGRWRGDRLCPPAWRENTVVRTAPRGLTGRGGVVGHPRFPLGGTDRAQAPKRSSQ